MAGPLCKPIALYDGQSVFGDPASFGPTVLMGSPGSVDAFLGLTSGTTVYGVSAGGGVLWGCAGTWLGGTEADVSEQERQLAGMAWARVVWGRPTGKAWPDDFTLHRNCYFTPTELVVSAEGPVANAVGQWSLSYQLVVRQTGGGFA